MLQLNFFYGILVSAKIVDLLGLCYESFFWEEIVDHQPAQPTNQFIIRHHQPVRLEYLTSLYNANYQNFSMILFQGVVIFTNYI